MLVNGMMSVKEKLIRLMERRDQRLSSVVSHIVPEEAGGSHVNRIYIYIYIYCRVFE
jgi:hypothetical protein